MPTRTIRRIRAFAPRLHWRISEASSMQSLSEPLRVGNGCGRHHPLSISLLQAATSACTQRCQNFVGALHHRFTRRVALALLTILTVAHPLLHPFEGGALDAAMVFLLARASHD